MAKYGLSYFIISWAKKKSVTFHLEAVTANPKLGLKELSIQVIHALHRLQKNKTSTRNKRVGRNIKMSKSMLWYVLRTKRAHCWAWPIKKAWKAMQDNCVGWSLGKENHLTTSPQVKNTLQQMGMSLNILPQRHDFMRASPHSENHSSASRIERLFLHSEWPFKNIEKKPRRQMEFRSTCNRMMLRKKHGSRPEWLMRFSTCGTCMAMCSSGT